MCQPRLRTQLGAVRTGRTSGVSDDRIRPRDLECMIRQSHTNDPIKRNLPRCRPLKQELIQFVMSACRLRVTLGISVCRSSHRRCS
jgi:hypothetical protein